MSCGCGRGIASPGAHGRQRDGAPPARTGRQIDPHDPRYAADLALAHHHESRWPGDWASLSRRELPWGVRLDDISVFTVLATAARQVGFRRRSGRL
jgi:hypothetical protein